jgi:hypothetical protein
MRGVWLTYTRRRLTFRRLLFFPLAIGVYLVFRGVVRAGRALDTVLFPGYREQAVRSPVFVIAFPRSGTTFLHRLMCLDEEQFTYHKTYQTLLPAISLYRLVGWVQRLDRRVAALLPRLVRRFNRDLFGGWRGIHAVGLQRVEEDEGVFLYPMYTPVFYMLFPFVEQFRELQFVDDLPKPLRQRIMDFYQSSLQRHIYADRGAGAGGRRLLVKNVHSTGRIRSILERFPDARFVFIMRNPYEAIPSLLSLYHAAWQMHSPDLAKQSPETHGLARMGYAYYRWLREACQTIPDEQHICVGFEELIDAPEATIERIYRHLGLPMSEAYRVRLHAAVQERSDHHSEHDYSLEEYGLDERQVYEELREVFEFLDRKRAAAALKNGPSPLASEALCPPDLLALRSDRTEAERAG